MIIEHALRKFNIYIMSGVISLLWLHKYIFFFFTNMYKVTAKKKNIIINLFLHTLFDISLLEVNLKYIGLDIIKIKYKTQKSGLFLLSNVIIVFSIPWGRSSRIGDYIKRYGFSYFLPWEILLLCYVFLLSFAIYVFLDFE